MPQSLSTHTLSVLLLDNNKSDALTLQQTLKSLSQWQLDVSIHLSAEGIFPTTTRRFDLLLVTANYAHSTLPQIVEIAKYYQPHSQIVLLIAAPERAASPQELIDAGRAGVGLCLPKDNLSAGELQRMLQSLFLEAGMPAHAAADPAPATGGSALQPPDGFADDVFDELSLGIIRFSASGDDFVYRSINRAAAESEQLNPQEILGRRLSGHAPGYENFNLASALRQVRAGAAPQTHRVLSLREGATASWRDLTIKQLRNGDLLVEIRSATDRAQRAADRRHSAQLWRHIARSLPDMCALLDESGKVAKVIAGDWQHLEIDRNTLTGQPIANLLLAEERDKCSLAIQKALNTGKTQSAFFAVSGHDNQFRIQVKISLLRADVDAPRQVVWVAREVSEHHIETNAIINDREFFNELLQRVPFVTAISSVEGRYEYANPAFAELLRRDSDTIVGKNDADLFPAKAALELQQLDNKVIAEGLAWQADIALTDHTNGAYFRVVKVPLYGMSMLTQHIFTFAMPMESATPAREATLAAGESQRQPMPASPPEAIDDLVSDIARDFNDVLVNLTEHTRMVFSASTEQPESEVTTYLRAVMKSSQRVRDLVGQMMAYEHAGKRQIAHSPVDLSLFTNGIIDLLGNTIGQQLRITRDVQQNVWVTAIDSLRMQNALIQLFRAAEKSFTASGQMLVRMQLLPELNHACAYCYGNVRGDFVAISLHSGERSEIGSMDDLNADIPADEALLSQIKRVHELIVPYSGHILFRGQPGAEENWYLVLATDPDAERSLKICQLDDG